MIIPPKLQPGDEIRVIAPSRSLSMIAEESVQIAKKKIELQGFKVTFSKNCRELDIFVSSSIESRVTDIHEAFANPKVKALFTVIGGYNTNQLLKYLDYELIKNNPKILCGYSDITALANAITTKTGLVTYSGLHFSTWSMEKEFDYSLEYFKKCLIEQAPFEVQPSPTWSDDLWFLDQKNRSIMPNEGFTIINPGEAEGQIFGGNLCTFNLLQGTEYMPDIHESMLFVEDDDFAGEDFAVEFDRNLQSLVHQPGFESVQALIIGRFQKNTNMNLEKLKYILQTKRELQNIPIIANADFGHTNPMFTFPIGGTARLKVTEKVELFIDKH